MSTAWAKGSTRAWRELRALVLARDGYRCTLRIEGVCTGSAPLRGGHVHHLHGKGQCQGCATDQPTHLAAACPACNLHVGEPSSADPALTVVTRW